MGSEIPMQLQKKKRGRERKREKKTRGGGEGEREWMCASIFKEKIKKYMYETKC